MEFKEQERNFIERTGNDFEFFYNKYYPKLIYYTTKMCSNKQQAEDITINSFMTAFEKIDKYEREKSQFSTWLFTIARNLMLQDIKNNKRHISIDMELDEEGTTIKDFIPEDKTDDEKKHDIMVKKAEIMKRQIKKLKKPYREVMEMREIKKMSYKEIADNLGLNLSTLKSRIRNSRRMLMAETFEEFAILDNADDIFEM